MYKYIAHKYTRTRAHMLRHTYTNLPLMQNTTLSFSFYHKELRQSSVACALSVQ